MKVVVYVQPDCPGCYATKKYLDKYGVEYSTTDISEDSASYAFVASLGYKQVPVVVAGDSHWSGFQPDRIAALKAPSSV